MAIESSVSQDLNLDDGGAPDNSGCGGTLNVLDDHDDWAALDFGGMADSDGAPPVPPPVVSCDNVP